MSKVLADRELLELLRNFTVQNDGGVAGVLRGNIDRLLDQPAEAEGVEVVAWAHPDYCDVITDSQIQAIEWERLGLSPVPLVRQSDHLAALSAVTAERDVFLRQVDTLTEWYSNSLDVIRDITAALPGTQYMDPPDGGDVSVPEQVRRMAKDADRYRWLRSRPTPCPTYGPDLAFWEDHAGEPLRYHQADAAIDAAMQGASNGD